MVHDGACRRRRCAPHMLHAPATSGPLCTAFGMHKTPEMGVPEAAAYCAPATIRGRSASVGVCHRRHADSQWPSWIWCSSHMYRAQRMMSSHEPAMRRGPFCAAGHTMLGGRTSWLQCPPTILHASHSYRHAHPASQVERAAARHTR